MSNGKYHLQELFATMEPNQAIFVHHLRTNPSGYVQTTGELISGDGKSACALGLGLEAFDMIAAYKTALASDIFTSYDPYRHIADYLNMPVHHVEQVYSLNDDDGLSFEAIGDVMADYFSQGNLFDCRTKGPANLYRESSEKAKKEEFAVEWDEVMSDYADFLRRAAEKLGVFSYDLAGTTLEDYDSDSFFDEYLSEL